VMPHAKPTVRANDLGDVLSGTRRIGMAWRGLTVEYAWRPPFQGAAPTRPNRLEVVFSAHASVALEQHHVVYEVDVLPGAFFVVGAEPTTLLNVPEHSDTLEIYPDLALLKSAAAGRNVDGFELEPTLRGQSRVTYSRDPAVLGIAHVLRRACMNRSTVSDIEASHLTHLLAERVLLNQHAVKPQSGPAPMMGDGDVRTLADFIEDNLAERVTLEDLSSLVNISPFHLARSFRRTTGLAPHQFVLARRVELAKRLLMTTKRSVQDIAWTVGYENVSHFRRLFASHLGVTPSELRRATKV